MRQAGWLVAPFLVALALRLPLRAVGVDDVRWPAGILDDRYAVDTLKTVSVPDGPWVLVIGGSSVFYAFDRPDLPIETRKQTFERGFPSDVALALSWTLHHTVPRDRWPARVVWGLNVAALVDRGNTAGHPCLTSVARSRPEPALLARTGLCDDRSAATWSERRDFAIASLDPWYDRRATTRDAAVTGLRRLFGAPPPPPGPDVWLHPERHDDAVTRRNLAAWERLGVFSQDAIHPGHARAVTEVGRLCREAGIPLTLVAMPEHSEARARYVPGAQDRFGQLLRETSDDVLDLWDALPDEGFYDQGHPNAIGRKRAGAALAERLTPR